MGEFGSQKQCEKYVCMFKCMGVNVLVSLSAAVNLRPLLIYLRPCKGSCLAEETEKQ